MKPILYACAGVLLLLLVSTYPGEAIAQDAPTPLPTTEEINQLLAGFDVPGLAMTTVTGCKVDEEVIHVGYSRLQPPTPVTSQTAFEAASLSKPVFAWLVMTLVDEGVIQLDQPIAATFDYPRILDKTAYAQITPRMVLTHRTGLPNWVHEDIDFHQRTTPIPFEAPPGTRYSYSGEAFQLLQAFVEQRTGRTLEQLFRQRLGDVMPHSTFVRPLPTELVASRGYHSASNPSSGRDMELPQRGKAASSLVTTARDYARFLSHVCLAKGLSPDTAAEMLRPQSALPAGEAPFPLSYGLGWMIADTPDGALAVHGGNNGEYRALAGFLRDSGDGLVVLTNGSNGQALIDVITTPPPSPNTNLSAPEAIFEEFWSIFNDGYALFGIKHVDWNAVYRVYRQRVTATTTDNQLWTVLVEIIRLLNDVHVTLTNPETGEQVRSGGRSIGVGPFDNGEFSLELVSNRYAERTLATAANGNFHYGWLRGEIGYIHIRRFADPGASAEAVDAIVESLDGAKAIVLDVRHNGGGNDRVGKAIASRFTTQTRPYMSVAMRKLGQLPYAFTSPVEWHLAPAGPKQFTGPIVLLINSRTISAAENFALAIRALPHATIFGETTAGVMADAGTQTLSNGWQVTVPVNQFRDLNGVSWEGVGITPDLWVSNSQEDIQSGTDRVLQTAAEFLLANAVQPWDRSDQAPLLTRTR